jgi:hypothetical protein
MSIITRRLSVLELSQQILEMAKTGVYRESVFEALQPLATKKQIKEAIAHAKRFGLHSVASLRDAELGTYYQLDLVKYQSLQHVLHSPMHLGKDEELVQRLTDATTSVHLMLGIAKGLAVMLAIAGMICWATGSGQVSFGLLSGAVSATGLWALQKSLVKQIPEK